MIERPKSFSFLSRDPWKPTENRVHTTVMNLPKRPRWQATKQQLTSCSDPFLDHDEHNAEALQDPLPHNADDLEQQLNLSLLIQLPSKCTVWNLAFEFVLNTFNPAVWIEFPFITFDFIPKDAQPDVHDAMFWHR